MVAVVLRRLTRQEALTRRCDEGVPPVAQDDACPWENNRRAGLSNDGMGWAADACQCARGGRGGAAAPSSRTTPQPSLLALPSIPSTSMVRRAQVELQTHQSLSHGERSASALTIVIKSAQRVTRTLANKLPGFWRTAAAVVRAGHCGATLALAKARYPPQGQGQRRLKGPFATQAAPRRAQVPGATSTQQRVPCQGVHQCQWRWHALLLLVALRTVTPGGRPALVVGLLVVRARDAVTLLG